MKILQEDLWTPGAEVYVASTNGVILTMKDRRRLVMGRGAAQEMRDRFPKCDEDFAECIEMHGEVMQHLEQDAGENETVWSYRLAMMRRPAGHLARGIGACTIGALQTKYHWKQKSPLVLVEASVTALARWIEATKTTGQVRLNMPGVGLGGLSETQIHGVLMTLPENVVVCHR